MRTVQSLKTVLASATDKPSASLVALLNVSLILVLLINSLVAA